MRVKINLLLYNMFSNGKVVFNCVIFGYKCTNVLTEGNLVKIEILIVFRYPLKVDLYMNDESRQHVCVYN